MVVLCCIVVVTGFLPSPVSRSSLSSPPSQVLLISAIGLKDPKSLYLQLFFHTWTIELSSTNPLWLCLSSTSSQTNVLSSLEDLKTWSHRRGAMRSTKLIQIELNQQGWNTYLQGCFFLLFGFWSCSGLSLLKACWNLPLVASLGRSEWRVYGVQFADGITQKLPRARGHKMS